MRDIPTRPGRGRAGVALLEAIIALAVLGSAGLSLIAILRQAVMAQVGSQQAEQVLMNADRVLAATTLLTRVDLERRIGTRKVGEFRIEVSRPEPTLFRIALTEVRAPDRLLLVTVIHRPGLDTGR